jgi:hypothetical protein
MTSRKGEKKMVIVNVTPKELIRLLSLRKVRVGSWQGEVIMGRDNIRKLRGDAKRWGCKYINSYANLCAKLRNEGVCYLHTYGPRGGFLGGLDSSSYVVGMTEKELLEVCDDSSC